jgi:hypothetical protein
MRDYDIRGALRAHLANQHRDEGALILDELRLCQGNARVDLAVINGSMTGYEIKSEHDTLRRLPGQLEQYGQVFDYVTLVVGPKYAERVREYLPIWCGLLVANPDGNGISFSTAIEPSMNPAVCPAHRVQFLWRDEALSMLEERGLLRGHRSSPRFKLWSVLVANIPDRELNDAVRVKIKSRGDWRSDQSHAPDGGMSSP